MKNKLILFDWGNIVESHTTGYTCYEAFNDLFKACGYTGNTSLSQYKLTSIKEVNTTNNIPVIVKNKLKLIYIPPILYKEYHMMAAFTRIKE